MGGSKLDDKYKFQKLFLIFANEDAGYDNGQVPSGYVKIEVRDGKAKLYSVVQNLKELPNQYSYRLYLINPMAQLLKPVYAGSYIMRQNNGELKWEFDAKNVIGSGKELDEYKVAAVCVEQVNSSSNNIICPLVAYRGKKVDWKRVTREETTKLSKNDKKEISQDVDGNQPQINFNKELFQLDKQEHKLDSKKPYAKLVDENTSDTFKAPENMPDKNINYDYTTVSNKSGDIDKLKASFDQCFERSEPFRSRRKEYVWWKASSPVYLNNMLYQCNIKTPLMFNPLVMMAHFKYRHLIAGIYTDKSRKQEYFVCGIPGAYNVDERPFGEMCKWVQTDTGRLQYGTFGYWLVFIEPKSGKFVAFD